jgi:hypothetical protein
VHITSGGTHVPRLDAAARAKRLGNNVYGSLPSAASALDVASLFCAAGWSLRKSGGTTYEAEYTFAELEFVPLEPVTFAGFVDPARIKMLLDTLTALGLSFEVELYCPDGTEQIYQSAPDGR